jgi:hypothetical protein
MVAGPRRSGREMLWSMVQERFSRVGPPSARTVPVLAEWEYEVAELAATAGQEFLVGGYSLSRNRASALLSRPGTGFSAPTGVDTS